MSDQRKRKAAELSRTERRMPKGTPFLAGTSGNPGGVSKEKRAFLERLKGDDAEEIYEAGLALIREGNPQMTIRAWEYLIGKPKESVEVTGKDGQPIKSEVTHALATVPVDKARLLRIATTLINARALEIAPGEDDGPK